MAKLKNSADRARRGPRGSYKKKGNEQDEATRDTSLKSGEYARYRRDGKPSTITTNGAEHQAATARPEQRPTLSIPAPRERGQYQRTAEISENGHPFVELPRKWAEGESSHY